MTEVTWHKIACYECGSEFYWARTIPRNLSELNGHTGVCSECTEYIKSFDEGHNAGAEFALKEIQRQLIGRTFLSEGCKVTIKSFKNHD